MAQFLGDIAGMLEIIAIAAGLIVLHIGRKDNASLLRLAGTILVVGGIAVGLCTTWYWFKYQRAGEFDSAWPDHSTQIMKHMEHMQQMMGGRMMMPMGDHGSSGMAAEPGMAPEEMDDGQAHSDHHPGE